MFTVDSLHDARHGSR